MKLKRTLAALALATVASTAATTIVAPQPAEAARRVHGFHNRVIYYYMDVNKMWPVEKAAERLDNGSPLDLRRIYHPCKKDHRCFDVKSGDIKNSHYLGLTTVWSDYMGYITYSRVQLDTPSGRHLSYSERYSVSIHELGHAVGLLHDHRYTSIMVDSSAVFPTTPDKGNLSDLNKLY
jgi:hypothetical protein